MIGPGNPEPVKKGGVAATRSAKTLHNHPGKLLPNRREDTMANRRINKASSDFESDLADLRDDISRLAGSVTDLMRSHANDASDQAYSFFGKARNQATSRASDASEEVRRRAYDARDRAADYASGARERASNYASDAKDRAAGYASDAQDRLGAFGSDVEGRIEKNPLTAVVVAGIAGLLMGMLSRSL